MKGVVLNRVGILGYFRPFLVLNRVRVSNPQRQPYTKTWNKCPLPPPGGGSGPVINETKGSHISVFLPDVRTLKRFEHEMSFRS